MKIQFILYLLLTALCAPAAARASFSLKNLQVEYTDAPLGVDVEKPRFSWQMEAAEGRRGLGQQAWQIVVDDEQGRRVWDSHRVTGDASLNIAYAGLPLQPTTRYRWTLRVWSNTRESSTASSWFETGLMGQGRDNRGWGDARWIGAEEYTLYAHYLPVFRLGFTLRLDDSTQTTRASLIYGANDERLMNRHKNLYHLENPRNRSYLRVELDVAPIGEGREARLNIYRVGYAPTDREAVPLKSFPIADSLLHADNRYGLHRIGLSSELGFTRFAVDGTEVGAANLNPLGQGGDFIAFPVVGDMGYAVPAGGVATFSQVEIAHFRSPANVVATVQQEPCRLVGGETELFTTFTPRQRSAPMLRTAFIASGGQVLKARLYATARGIYEIYLNGKRVGDDYFNPGLTQYNKTHLYQVYDVTADIRAGRNALGAQLAEGWWSGGATFTGDNWNFFGDRQSLLAKLVITYADGRTEEVVTRPGTWRCSTDGPLSYGSFFQGEVYDARREAAMEGWSRADYDDSGWQAACEIPLAGTVSTEGTPDKPRVDDYTHFELTGQTGQTVRAVDERVARSVEEVRPGVFLYDMGQNMAGVPRIRLSGLKPGTRVCLRYAEVTYPDLPEYAGNVGMPMLENIRAAMAQDIYIARGGEEVIAPRFTYHGYRFVEITGIGKPLPVEAVRGTVLSSIHRWTADYETSHPLVNRLWENIRWSARANFISIPTDCPQRNERLGWMGDISVFSRTATYLADLPQFLRRYVRSMRDVQRPDGRFPDIAPMGGGFGGVLWGSAGITVPWECYRQYGDLALLQEHYPAMKRYIDYILQKTIDPATGLLVQRRAWGDLADWLGPEDGRNDKSLLWEAYFIYDLTLMEKIASLLGLPDEAARFGQLCAERKAFFCRTYIDPSTGRTRFSAFVPEREGEPVDTQTSYVLPLAFGLVEGEQKELLTARLREAVERTHRTEQGVECPAHALMTGFIGTAWICPALSDNGLGEVAYRLLQQTEYPSWLYSVCQGATTIWERLNSYTHTHGFGGNNRMNSFNHYSFGAVGAWLCSRSLGIERDGDTPAFKHFVLRPEADGTHGITYARGHYESRYGRIESGWRWEADTLHYECTVPANTTARLHLPASSAARVTEGGKPLKRSKGVECLSEADGEVVLRLPSGRYSFVVAPCKGI